MSRLLPVLALGLAPGLWAAPPTAVSGITEPILDVVLGSAVAGIIRVQHFEEGAFVREGEIIVELDKRLEELEVERRQLVRDARKNDLEEIRTLYDKSKGVSQDELEKAELDYRVAVVEHKMAAEQLGKRIVTAPFSGTITEFSLDPGEATEAYQPLVRLVDTRRCYFVSNVEAGVAARLQLKQTVHLEIDTGAVPVSVDGTVVYLSPVVDPSSGLLKVKVLFDNAQGRIRPGLAGSLRLE